MTRPTEMVSGQTQLETYFTAPDITFHFAYPIFAWLPWLPRWGFEAMLWLLGIAGIGMALGLWYRLAAALVLASWGYLYVIESTRTYWQSYHYLEMLFCLLMPWIPANRRFSLDAWRHPPPEPTVPFWPLALLRGQLVVTYFYAGVSKLNADWLLDGAPIRWIVHEPGVTEPYRRWLSPAVFQAFEAAIHREAFVYFICVVGAGFDLAVGFLLLARRTRILGLAAMLLFHGTNHLLLYDNIDWLPLLGAATVLVFLDPDWPERVGRWLQKPRIRKPDWRWALPGAVGVPGLGLLLGWKLCATAGGRRAGSRLASNLVAVAVLGWVGVQTVLPLRHYLIPGDARFTYEGLSFSWRLKADDHRARAAELWLEDPGILPGASAGTDGIAGICWDAWPGERVLYREVPMGRVDTSRLPRLVVTLEPLLGERILWIPGTESGELEGPFGTEETIRRAWQARFGRRPARVEPTLPLATIVAGIADGLRATGNQEEAHQLEAMAWELVRRRDPSGAAPTGLRVRIREFLEDLSSRNPDGTLTEILRHSHAFALTGAQSIPSYLIEDPELFRGSERSRPRIQRAAWKNGPESADPRATPAPGEATDPLVIHLGDLGLDQREMLPSAYLMDRLAAPDQPAEIRWNMLRDLTSSKLMHVSNQPFFLRRYAQRVAGLWQAQARRTPAVHARTAMSLNGRPFQELVDPTVDLASVPVRWFGHNAWVRDLETPRIPIESLRRPRLE